MIFDDRNKIRTGDTLLFSGSTTTAFLIKFFTSSKYNHMGIAIWLDPKNRIIRSSKGNRSKLYVLEINAHERYVVLSNTYTKGLALTDYDLLLEGYNEIYVRHINSDYVDDRFCKKAKRFMIKHAGIGYSSTLGPIIGVWIGCPVSGIKREKDEMFCSEMAAYFYLDVCGTLPTSDKPARLYKPDDYAYPCMGIFEGSEYSIYTDYSDASVALIIPIITALFLAVLISMTFPRKRYI